MKGRTSALKPILSALVLLSTAATAGGDSIFSVNGLGEISYPVEGQARGMGGVNVAFLDGRGVSLINPAIIGVVDTTTMTALFLFEQRNVKDARSRTRFDAWGPRLARLVIPISHGVVVGAGIAPFSDVNFHLSRDAEAFDEPYSEPYRLHVSAEGGTRLGSVALAKNIGDRLFLGAAVNFIFGSITEEWKRDFVSPGYVDSDDLLKTSYFGQAFVGGIAFRPHPRWSVGALFCRSGPIDATTNRSAVSGSLGEEKHRLDFPDAYGLGMTYRLTARLLVGGEVYTRLWEKFRLDEAQLPQYENTVRLAFGCELAPSTDKPAPFYAKAPWRIGAYHQPWPYKDSSGDRLSETFFTLGTSLFFKEGRGVVDLAIEIGRRGDVAKNGAQEWVFRQSFSVVGWERWFQKKEY